MSTDAICGRWPLATRSLCAVVLALVSRPAFADGPPPQSPSLSPPASGAPASPGFVRVLDHRFVLDGNAFVLRGVDYVGGWRAPTTIDAGPELKFGTMWAIYRDWTQYDLDQDFRFLRTQLNATAVRIGTPTEFDFASSVQYHDYRPWYNPDGSITDEYAKRLVWLADAALRNGIRIQFCLLWGLGHDIEADPAAFRHGGAKDLFYARQVRSVAAALRDHPGVLGYSIGNEVLVAWTLNGTHPSWFEPRAAGFILRRIRDLRAAAPAQLVTTDEGAAPEAEQWYAPGPEFATIPDVDGSNGGQAFRLVDQIDYLGAHFYPEHFAAADLAHPEAKIAAAARQLAEYLAAARAAGKPVVLDEFGLPIDPPTLDPALYGPVRDRLFARVLADGQRLGLQGLLAWSAMPTMVLRPGTFVIAPSKLNPYSPTEVDLNAGEGHTRRILFLDPSWNLFDWKSSGDAPVPTNAARALAASWPYIPPPVGHY